MLTTAAVLYVMGIAVMVVAWMASPDLECRNAEVVPQAIAYILWPLTILALVIYVVIEDYAEREFELDSLEQRRLR